MHVRRYLPADREAVWELHNVALDAAGARFPGPWDADFDDIEGIYLRSGGEFLVGTVDGRVVAMGALRPCDSRTVELKRMRVVPELQRSGLGQAILDRLEERARMLGFARIVLDTTPQQVAARRFYRKNGYVEMGRRTRGELEELLFEKRL
jgi:ribosomal protein S18 acetylase RimI-like enzyme